MALIAKETLTDGFTVVANPGTIVSPEMVEKNGWQDKVEDDGKGDAGTTGTDTTTDTNTGTGTDGTGTGTTGQRTTATP
jgi:hypothetical protein